MTRTVDLVLTIGMFAIVAIIGITWLTAALVGQGANKSTCITSYDVNDPEASIQACEADTYDIRNVVTNKINEHRGTRF